MDTVSAEVRSRIMASIRGRDTTPELVVRSTLHRLGFRFRIHTRTLPGSPDVVLAKHRAVIFVHGCFWHAHRCRAGRKAPKTNAAFWQAKRDGNRARDRRVVRALRRAGWRVLVLWECQLRDAARLERALRGFLGPATSRAKVTSSARASHRPVAAIRKGAAESSPARRPSSRRPNSPSDRRARSG